MNTKTDRLNKGKTGWFPSLTAALLAAAAFSQPAWAVGPDFQAGKAHILSAEEGGFGWEKVFDAKGYVLPSAEVSKAAFMMDDASKGVKMDLTALVPGSSNLVRNAMVAAPYDIGNTYVALVPGSDGKMVILGGIERLSNEDGQMTLEFNLDPVRFGDGSGGQWELTGSRTQGDILLRLKFADGQLASAEVSRWEGAPDKGAYQQVGTLNGEGCDGGGENICAASNEEAIPSGPWKNLDPDGDPAIVPARRFVEFKINAGALVEAPAYTSVCALTSQDIALNALHRGN